MQVKEYALYKGEELLAMGTKSTSYTAYEVLNIAILSYTQWS